MRVLNISLELNEVDANRKDDCVLYDRCLKAAAMAKSFSCKNCGEYKKGGKQDITDFLYRSRYETLDRSPKDFDFRKLNRHLETKLKGLREMELQKCRTVHTT